MQRVPDYDDREEESEVHLHEDELHERELVAELWAAVRRATPTGTDMPASPPAYIEQALAALSGLGWTDVDLEREPSVTAALPPLTRSLVAVVGRRLRGLVETGARPVAPPSVTETTLPPPCDECDRRHGGPGKLPDTAGRPAEWCPRCSAEGLRLARTVAS